MKVLVATEKPFAPAAVKGIREIIEKAGCELALLEKYSDKSELLEAVKDADALIIRSDKVTAEVIAAANNLKIVVRAGAGYDNVDLAAATAKGITVMNTPGQNSNAVAELALGMMVYMARGQFNGKAGTELKGKKMGIHAYGHVGVNIARIAQGFGMEVCALDPFISAEKMEKDNVTPMKTVEEMYSSCDYISLNLPLIEATRGMVNYQLMSMMKEGACIVNTARKEVVDEDALKEIMEKRADLKYVSDIAPTIADELVEKYPDRCYFTPKKMGAQTKEANINAGLAAANQIVGFIKNGDTTFKVNK